jgi:hypothetical protein
MRTDSSGTPQFVTVHLMHDNIEPLTQSNTETGNCIYWFAYLALVARSCWPLLEALSFCPANQPLQLVASDPAVWPATSASLSLGRPSRRLCDADLVSLARAPCILTREASQAPLEEQEL